MSSSPYLSSKQRLKLYFTIVPDIDTYYDTDKQVSILSISKDSDIPVEIVRNDLSTIFSAYKKASYFFPFSLADEECEFDDILTAIDEILEGKWDSYALICNINVHKNNHTIELQPNEYVALEEYLSTSTNFIYSGQSESNIIPCIIKENFYHHDNPTKLISILQTLNEAINNKRQIFFKYSNGKKTNRIQITPIKIIYDNEENLYSILGLKNKNYVVYKIGNIVESSPIEIFEGTTLLDNTVSTKQLSYIHILNSEAEKYDEKMLEDKIPHVWKNAFESKKSTHVKVKFASEKYDSVLRDLAYRNPKETLSPIDGDFFFFEDDIYGFDAFYMWVRTYGSSAVIIEPTKMAMKRIDSLKKTLEYYK